MRRITTVASVLIPLIPFSFPQLSKAGTLEPATLKAWDAYVESANLRMEQRLSPGSAFLWLDEEPERLARVRVGEIVVAPAGLQNPKKVPSGLIHHWVGATFISGVTLPAVLRVVRDYAQYKDLYQPGVADSKVIDTDESKDRFSMVLIHKSTFLKTALDADYESQYIHLDDRRAYSLSRATRIQEVHDYGASDQRLLEQGEGRGIIWRLFSITRYAERDGGVYIELEAIGLSRDIPASLRFLVEPIVRRISEASLSTSLRQTESAVQQRAEVASRKTGSVKSADANTHGGTPPDSSRLVHSLR